MSSSDVLPCKKSSDLRHINAVCCTLLYEEDQGKDLFVQVL